MSEPPAPRSLCIVSSDPVRSGQLLTALRTMVDTHEGLEIVVDRRRGRSGGVTDPPPDDRRRQPLVDVKVKTDGFAIVPSPSPSRAGAALAEAQPERLELPLFEADPAEIEYARVLEFVRQRRSVRRRRLALCVGAALVLLALVPAMQAFTSRARTAAPPPVQSPAAIATAPPPRPTAPALPSGESSLSSETTRSEPTPPAVERTDRPRVQGRPPAAAPAPRVMPSREIAPPPAPPQPVPPQPVAPPAVAQPPAALPPSEVTSRPEPPAQTVKAPEVVAPRPQPSASTQPARPVQSPEPARSPEAAPPRQALGRPPDAPPARPAPTATIPDAPPASAGGSPSDHRGGVGDQFKNLGTVIERDLADATADAKRQGDDFKALQNRFRRTWEGIKQGFGGSAEK